LADDARGEGGESDARESMMMQGGGGGESDARESIMMQGEEEEFARGAELCKGKV